LRELGFAKYLENARIKVYHLNHITILEKENNPLVWQPKSMENLLTALYDGRKQFIGIGLLRAVDHQKNNLKILTGVNQKPASVAFGRVRLDLNLREIPE
jgi:polynucleotide 5'-kinase involved in rRNA processing